jgi:hypothetical protein
MGFAMAFSGGLVEDRKEFDRKQRAVQRAQAAAHRRAWRHFRASVRRTFRMFRR